MRGLGYDVVIVGGGIAGLTAAWRLRGRDVLLLEGADRLGGRVRSEPCGEYWLNYGAHLLPAPGSLIDGMARECGLETVPVTGGMMGLAVGSRILDRGRVETFPFRLPLRMRDRIAFARAGVKVQRAVSRYHRSGGRLDFDDDRTFEAFLGPLPPAVRQIFSCAAHRATAELDELSAGCGIGLFALVWVAGARSSRATCSAGPAACRRRSAASSASARTPGAACARSGSTGPT